MAASTYLVSGNRAGQSAVVQETTAKTYPVALPAVLTETGAASAGTTQARVMVLA
jgi:hypothetical protein